MSKEMPAPSAAISMDTYIRDRVDDQIHWYDKKAKRHKIAYLSIQTAETIIAALITLLSGHASIPCIPWIVGILGFFIATLGGISKLFKFHENWMQYRSTYALLLYQKHLYLTGSSPYSLSGDSIDTLFVKNIEQIISSENNQWKSVQQAALSKQGGGNQTGS